jgi:UTP--glucose-1-phosphate uridylyltransferase
MPEPNNSKNLLTQMIEELDSKPTDSSIIGVDEVAFSEVNKYGIIKNNGAEKIVDMVEKPAIDKAPSNLAIIGRYILQPKIFEYLEKFQIGSGGEIQLTDAIASLLKEEPVFAYEYDGVRYDCGSKLGYLKASVEFALRHPEVSTEFAAYLKSRSLT